MIVAIPVPAGAQATSSLATAITAADIEKVVSAAGEDHAVRILDVGLSNRYLLGGLR
jgi:hypothetical protein